MSDHDEHEQWGAAGAEYALQLWEGANTLGDLCRLGASWLEGTLSSHLTYQRPDTETLPLLPALAEFNRLGYWTDHSQPGEDFDGWQQRAHVTGYCSQETSNRILTAAASTDLIVLASPAPMEYWLPILISRGGRTENTWGAVHVPPREEFRHDELSEEALQALDVSWFVEVIDPVWGRNDLLWEAVLTALRTRPDRHVVEDLAESWGPTPGVRFVPWE